MDKHVYTSQEDAWLLGQASTTDGRIPWTNITKEFKEKFNVSLNPESLRGRVRRLTGTSQAGDNLDPSVAAESMLSSEDVIEDAEELLERLVMPKFPDMAVPDFQWEQWYEAADQLSEMTNRADPTITSAIVHIPTDKPIAWSPVGDWHLGSRFVAYKTFRALLELCIDTPGLYWTIFGDEADNFPMGWLPPAMGQVINPIMQRRLVGAIARRLIERGKVLSKYWGNHDGFDERYIGETLADALWQGNVPYFHGKGVVRLRLGLEEETAEEYIIYGSHEFKGNSIYNINHAQMRALLWEVPQADFVVMGHRHKYGYAEVPHHEQAYLAGLHSARTAHLLQIGTAKTGPDRYTIRGWSQGMFEWPIFILYPNEHKIKRVYDFEDIEHFLDIKIDKKLLRKLKEVSILEGGQNVK